MTHEQINDNHFARLNGYRDSREYHIYRDQIGAGERNPDEFPSLIGDRWEIDAEIYNEFLGMLPPLGWKNGSFFMLEYSFDDITTKYTKEGDRYYCEFARYPEKIEASIPTETPWGQPQSTREIAPGIVRYDTASHGGYYVSPERVAEMPKPLQAFKPWAGSNWYEEDCDWSIVALAFPQFFDGDAVPLALKTLKNYQPELYEQMVADIAGTKPARNEGRQV